MILRKILLFSCCKQTVCPAYSEEEGYTKLPPKNVQHLFQIAQENLPEQTQSWLLPYLQMKKLKPLKNGEWTALHKKDTQSPHGFKFKQSEGSMLLLAPLDLIASGERKFVKRKILLSEQGTSTIVATAQPQDKKSDRRFSFT